MPSTTDLPLAYGQRLRSIMQDNHLTTSDLCRKLGFHSTTQAARFLKQNSTALARSVSGEVRMQLTDSIC